MGQPGTAKPAPARKAWLLSRYPGGLRFRESAVRLDQGRSSPHNDAQRAAQPQLQSTSFRPRDFVVQQHQGIGQRLGQSQYFSFAQIESNRRCIRRQQRLRYFDNGPLLTMPDQPHRKGIGRTAAESLRHDLIVHPTRDLDFIEQASEQIQPIHFAQGHQRAGIAQHGGHDL
jgi:hypothetical protein